MFAATAVVLPLGLAVLVPVDFLSACIVGGIVACMAMVAANVGAIVASAVALCRFAGRTALRCKPVARVVALIPKRKKKKKTTQKKKEAKDATEGADGEGAAPVKKRKPKPGGEVHAHKARPYMHAYMHST